MAGQVLPFRALQPKDRRALKMLRQAWHGEQTEALAELASTAREHGLLIAKLSTPFATRDELSLLAWLTLLQRQKSHPGYAIPHGLYPSLVRSAKWLEGEGCRLGFHNVQRVKCGVATASAPLEPPIAEDIRLTLPEAVTEALQARAIEFVREKRVADVRAFASIGVSLQMVKGLCKRGALRRVQFGLYAATCGAGPGLQASN